MSNPTTTTTTAGPNTPPTVIITNESFGPVLAGGTTIIRFAISKPVTTFTVDDITITGGSLSNFISISAQQYTALLTPTIGSTSCGILVEANVFTDLMGNGNVESNTLTISLSTDTPTIIISRSGSGSLESGNTDTISFILSAPSTNFTLSDIFVSGGYLSSFTAISSTNYTAIFTPFNNINTNATIKVLSGQFTDSDGNNNSDSNILSIPINSTNPTVLIEASSLYLPSDQTSTIYFTFSEQPSSFNNSMITVTGGVLSTLVSVSSVVYSAELTPNINASSVSISVPANKFTNSSGSLNIASNLLSIIVISVTTTTTTTSAPTTTTTTSPTTTATPVTTTTIAPSSLANTMRYGAEVLSPAPIITIKTELNYSGENIIGYTYVLSLRGYATTYSREDNSITNIGSEISLKKVLDNISKVKSLLTANGNNLSLYDDSGELVINAKGGTLRSLTFNESPNNWTGYAEYSADIEFNELELINGTSLDYISCDQSFVNSDSLSSNIIDLTQYKLKSFSDGWNISTDDALYNHVDIGSTTIDNTSLNISYNISATGKHFFVDGRLKPAWEQAKNFAQERLHTQVTNFLTGVLKVSGSVSCEASEGIDSHGDTSSTNGILQNLDGSYQIFNETISCETSESEGSFSATYNAVLKRNQSNTYHHPATKHTLTKTITTDNSNRKNTTIAIQGTIEGLIEGGLIRTTASGFSLPANGPILIGYNGSSVTKYANALTGLNKIINSQKDDLLDNFKTILNINNSSLNLPSQHYGNSSILKIKPLSFNLTHDYHNGTITYNVEYSTAKTIGTGDYANISISIEQPTPVLAELNIPHYGVFIQSLDTVTPKRINITIEGKRNRICCWSSPENINTALKNMTANTPISLPSYINLTNYILTQKQRIDNLSEGTYSINLGYICATGCYPS